VKRWGLPGTIGLAGWLFADILLALAVIFLVSQPGSPPMATLEATPVPTATPISTPTAAPTPTCRPAAVLDKAQVNVPNSPGSSIPTIAQLQAALDGYQGRSAGLVLTYVRAPQPGQGQRLAADVNARLMEALPNVFGRSAIYEQFDYVDSNTSRMGEALIQIYFLAGQC